MKRSITLALTLAAALAAQPALTACEQQVPVTTIASDPPASAAEIVASLPGATPADAADGSGAPLPVPMDSISSASAIMGSDTASAMAAQASDARAAGPTPQEAPGSSR